MTSPKEILQKYWFFSSFKKPQEEIINAVLKEENVIALLPTGGGKSVCFQVPALVKKGICLVISPLVALIQDQLNNLTEKGIKAASIPSGISQDEIITLFDNLRFGNYKFLYLSPERLQSSFIQEKIKQLNVSLIAIDEAHCISEWGHDFRPSYRNINILLKLKPNVNTIALTASATQKVIKDIIFSLDLKNVKIFKKSFFRENLAYQIFETEDKLYKLKQIFTKTKSPGIVYVNTRNKTQEISNYLNANGFKSSLYHGGLSPLEKQLSFDNWMTEKTPIIVATNAFGMGIDKPNVRIVVHLNLPNSLENYLQEAGRAGRNGEKAFSVVLQNKNDVVLFQEMLKNHLPTLNEIKTIHQKLYQHFQIAKGEFVENSFDFSFLDFCNKYQFIPNKTYNALKILQNNGIVELNDDFQKKSTIQFLINSSQVLKYANQNFNRKKIINTLLRAYGGLFEQPTKIDEFFLAKKAGVTSHKIIEALNNLDIDNLIEYRKAIITSKLYFLMPREDNKTINRISKNITTYLQQKQQKASDLLSFIENNTICRSVQILHYFNEKKAKKCLICDVCLQKKQYQIKDISIEIVHILSEKKEASSKEICKILSAKEQDILINLQHLLAKNKIAINSYNKYYLKYN